MHKPNLDGIEIPYNKWQEFIDGSEDYNVNEVYLVVHALDCKNSSKENQLKYIFNSPI